MSLPDPRIVASVTDPSSIRLNPLWPCDAITTKSAALAASITAMLGWPTTTDVSTATPSTRSPVAVKYLAAACAAARFASS